MPPRHRRRSNVPFAIVLGSLALVLGLVVARSIVRDGAAAGGPGGSAAHQSAPRTDEPAADSPGAQAAATPTPSQGARS